jgi:hypothetical protein
VLNGYTDRVHTPMSRWMPNMIDGPVHNPIADVRWNAAELRGRGRRPAEPVLLSAVAMGWADVYIVSHNALPERRALILDVYLRTDTAGARRLAAAPDAAGHGRRRVARLRLPRHRAGHAPAADADDGTAGDVDARRPATERPREALPSTF